MIRGKLLILWDWVAGFFCPFGEWGFDWWLGESNFDLEVFEDFTIELSGSKGGILTTKLLRTQDGLQWWRGLFWKLP